MSDMMGGDDVRARFHAFLKRFWQLARAGDRVKFVREVDSMISAIFRSNGAPFRNQQVEPLAMMNVDCLGNVSTFSPELLGYKNADYNDFLIGNINTDSMEEIRASRWLAAMQRDIDAGVEACRTSCEYFSVCAGGAPMNKLSENGTFRMRRRVSARWCRWRRPIWCWPRRGNCNRIGIWCRRGRDWRPDAACRYGLA